MAFVERDLLAFYRASRRVLANLLSGPIGLPMWNPWVGSGQPFAANPQNELFHPLSWLFAGLPFEWAFRLQVILPVLAAGPAMAFLLLTLGRSRFAALFGALGWAFGGYILSTTNLPPILVGAAAAPALLAFLVRLARRPSKGDAAGAALSLGWMILAGEPMVLAAILAAPAAIFEGTRLRAPLGGRPNAPRSRARSVAALCAALALGLLVGAGTIVPGALLFAKTVRAGGLPAGSGDSWSMPPIRLAELWVPRLFGHLEAPAHEDYWGLALYGEKEGPYLFSVYAGLLLGVAAVAAWASRPGPGHAWGVVAIVGFLLAIGSHGPLWPLARGALPFLSGFRYPEKFALLVALAVTVSGAAGLDLLLRRKRGPLVAAGTLLVVAAVAGAAAALGVLDLPALVGGGAAPARWGAIARRDGAVLLATAGAGLAALLAVRRGRRTGGTLFVALLGLDLTFHATPLLRSVPAGEVDAPPPWVGDLLARDASGGRVFHLAAWLLPRGERGWLVAPPMPAYWGLATTLESDYDLTELAWSHRATESVWTLARKDPASLAPILGRRGVSAVVRPHPEARVVDGGLAYPERLASPLVVLRSTEAPRAAFVAESVRVARSVDDWAVAMRDLGGAAARAVVLHDGPEPAGPPGAGELLAFSRRPDRIEADVRCDGPRPCLLALTETWDEHWSARIGPAAVAPLRADLSLMALEIPVGRHGVRLVYDDPFVRLGGALTLAGSLGALVLAIGSRRRRGTAVPGPSSGDTLSAGTPAGGT